MVKNKKLPLILQSEVAECGLASLTMLLVFYGCEISLSQMRRLFKFSLKGTTLYQLKKIAETFGLLVQVLRINISQLTTVKLPFLIHWNMNHFMVVKEIKDKYIVVHDPAGGVRAISMEQVNCSFTGIVLEILPTSEFKFARFKQSLPYSLVGSIFKKYSLTLLKILLFSGLIQLSYICGVKIIQKCIDASTHFFHYNLIYLFILGFFAAKLIEICSLGLRSFMIARVGAFINCEFALNVVQHLLSLPLSFFSSRHLGDIVSRFGSIDKIRSILTEGLVEGIIDGVVIVIVVMMLWLMNIKLAIAVLLSSSCYLLSRLYYYRNFKEHQEELLYARAKELSYSMETVRGISSIKLFSKEKTRLYGWKNKLISSLNALTRITWHKIFYDTGKHFLYGIELIFVLKISCSLIESKIMSLGMLYAFLTYRQQFVLAVNSLVDKIQDYKILKLQVERVNDILLEPNEKKFLNRKLSTEMGQGNLVVENVSFAYAFEEKPILQNLNLTISQGECIVITGPSGCGKSTLLQIMMGLLTPSGGQLYFNQIPIYPERVGCYRKKIAGVLQEDILFSGTISENISFFDSHPDRERINSCAKLAGILDEIEDLPMRFDTLIGDMGSVFSGGQKQRLLLARALYAKPAILFLDEASSHLDVKKEHEINHAIRSLGITLVMVAHREETIKMADRVIYLTSVMDKSIIKKP